MADLRKAKLQSVPWKFIEGPWHSKNRAAAFNPIEPSGWSLFLQVTLCKEARSMVRGRPYALKKIPKELKHRSAYLMRNMADEGRLIIIADEQEDLLQVLGWVDPDYGILADQALRGMVPVMMVDGKAIIHNDTGRAPDHDHVIVNPETFETKKIEEAT